MVEYWEPLQRLGREAVEAGPVAGPAIVEYL